MNEPKVAVVDLGSSKIVALLASPDDDGMVRIEGLVELPCKGLKKGVITDLEETARTIDAAIRKLNEATQYQSTKFVVSISGSHVEGSNVQGFKPMFPRNRTITHQDVLEVLNHSRSVVFPPDREQIQAIPREFRIDGHRNIQKPVGMSGSKLEVVTYLVSAQIAQVQNIERAFSLTGKELDQLVLSPLAAGIAVLNSDEIESGTAILDIGAGKSDLAIFAGGSLAYSACLPIGSWLVTSDISKLLKTTPEEAERLKVDFGSAFADAVQDQDSVQVKQLGQPLPRPMQRKVLAEIIESRVREIAIMTRQHIEKSGFWGMLPGGIVLTGGGASLSDTDKLFRSVMPPVRVRIAEPDLGDSKEHKGLGVAVGLAQYVIQSKEDLQPINSSSSWQEKVKSIWSMLNGKE